jgi:cytochrome c-550 PedF
MPSLRLALPLLAALPLGLLAAAGPAGAHGDVAPQAVDVSALPPLGEEIHGTNPYRGTPAFEAAAKVGDKAYNQNCARCHGLGAVSGGIAPDLRMLVPGDDDEYFYGRVMSGSVRNGVTYMPAFSEIFGQEAIWAIRSWLDTVAQP